MSDSHWKIKTGQWREDEEQAPGGLAYLGIQGNFLPRKWVTQETRMEVVGVGNSQRWEKWIMSKI